MLNLFYSVIQNLLINAIKYSDPDKEVVVRFTDVERNILIEIEDNGPGIEDKHVNGSILSDGMYGKIFNRIALC